MRRPWIALLPMLLLPLIASVYQTYVVETLLIACIGALGLNLLVGYAGQISTGHGAFIGVGAFATAVLSSRLEAPMWLCIPAAAGITTVVGVGVGLPSVRIRGLYLAVATLAAQVVIGWALSRPFLAGGGSIAAARPQLLRDDHAYYVVVLGVVALAALFLHNLSRTRLGRAMHAVRERELAASVIGINCGQVKLIAFGLCAFYAGLTGSLLAYLSQTVNFEQFQLELSIQYLAMIVIGGLGSVRGSILGAAFVTLLPIALRAVVDPLADLLPGTSALYSSLQLVLFGLVIVGFMLVQPRGLAQLKFR